MFGGFLIWSIAGRMVTRIAGDGVLLSQTNHLAECTIDAWERMGEPPAGTASNPAALAPRGEKYRPGIHQSPFPEFLMDGHATPHAANSGDANPRGQADYQQLTWSRGGTRGCIHG
jgi:hypothetical protein